MRTPCPDWCTADHRIEREEVVGFDIFEGRRLHSGTVGAFVGSEDLVEVVRCLTTNADGTADEPYLYVMDRDGGLSPDDAEQLAALLLDAAAQMRGSAVPRG